MDKEIQLIKLTSEVKVNAEETTIRTLALMHDRLPYITQGINTCNM